MNTKNIIVLAVFIATSLTTLAQNTEGVSIAPNVTPPHPSAMLDVSSTDKGVLIPRMTAMEKNAIQSPKESLLIYQTNGDKGYYYWDETESAWIPLLSGTTAGYWEKVDLVASGYTNPFNYTRLKYEDDLPNRGELRFGFVDPDVSNNQLGSWFTQKGGMTLGLQVTGGSYLPVEMTDVTYAQLFHDNTLAFNIRSHPNLSVPANLHTNITSKGSLYVGTSTAGKDVIFNPGNVVAAWIKDDGNIYATGTLKPSDINLKTNVATLDSSLSKITELRGVSYKWIDTNKSQATQLGVIAQEVEVVFPELVVGIEVPTNDGSPSSETVKSVNYSGLIAPMIEAIKEQQELINALEQRIEALENQ